MNTRQGLQSSIKVPASKREMTETSECENKEWLEEIEEFICDTNKEVIVSTDERKRKNWVQTLMSCLESLNEYGEEYGFHPFYTGNFKIDYSQLNSQMDKMGKYLVDTLKSLNVIHEKMDDVWNASNNLRLTDVPKEDLEFTLDGYIKKRQEKEKKQGIRRKTWIAQLNLTGTTLENYNNDSDVDSVSEDEE
jgi:hypothetical protein